MGCLIYIPITIDVYFSIRAQKARARSQEYANGSSLSAVSVSSLLGLLLPHLMVGAIDLRELFQTSRGMALEAVCAGECVLVCM